MGKFTRLAFVGLLSILVTGAFGQNPIHVESTDLYKDGTDAGGTTPAENTDSVSVGSTMKYYIIPDTSINTSYSLTAGGVLTGSLSSTFNWFTSNAAGGATCTISPEATYPTFQNYKQVNFTHIGSLKLKVASTATLGGCTGDTTIVPVAIVPLPTVQFSPTTSGGNCFTQADGSVGYSLTLPVSWTSPVGGAASGRQLKVNFTISCTNAGYNGGSTLTSTNVAVTETGAGTGTFNIAGVLNYYGIYTITLTAINDRISVKSGLNGTVGVQNVYTFSVSRTPVTAPVYHVPNTGF